jgi:hypothetical protein
MWYSDIAAAMSVTDQASALACGAVDGVSSETTEVADSDKGSGLEKGAARAAPSTWRARRRYIAPFSL